MLINIFPETNIFLFNIIVLNMIVFANINAFY